MKPHLELAEENGVTIAIENHGRNLIESPDSIRWLLEFSDSPRLGIALAPAHLPQEPQQLAKLVREIAPRMPLLYGWQFGKGFSQPLPATDQLMQMPGRGTLDFGPIIETLRSVRYQGWVEVLMHPTPRGIPIRETTTEVTAEIRRSHEYLAAL